MYRERGRRGDSFSQVLVFKVAQFITTSTVCRTVDLLESLHKSVSIDAPLFSTTPFRSIFPNGNRSLSLEPILQRITQNDTTISSKGSISKDIKEIGCQEMIRKMGTIDLFGAASQFIFILKRTVLQKLSFHIDRNAKMGEETSRAEYQSFEMDGKD